MSFIWERLTAWPVGLFFLFFAASAAANGDVPADLPGATVIPAQRVRELASEARLIDTRVLHDYLAGHIPGAIHIAYKERSARAVDFDPAQDEVLAFLTRLRKFAPQPNTQLVFYCNGPACWKSWKAAQAVLKNGYRRVYWFRGGMAEWQQNNFETVNE
jgi:rhodanese-related sulfurtransferase